MGMMIDASKHENPEPGLRAFLKTYCSPSRSRRQTAPSTLE
jgi:hypothetical protein